jgi:hypothetical protein
MSSKATLTSGKPTPNMYHKCRLADKHREARSTFVRLAPIYCIIELFSKRLPFRARLLLWRTRLAHLMKVAAAVAGAKAVQAVADYIHDGPLCPQSCQFQRFFSLLL